MDEDLERWPLLDLIWRYGEGCLDPRVEPASSVLAPEIERRVTGLLELDLDAGNLESLRQLVRGWC